MLYVYNISPFFCSFFLMLKIVTLNLILNMKYLSKLIAGGIQYHLISLNCVWKKMEQSLLNMNVEGRET